ALDVALVDIDLGVALAPGILEPLQRQPRREHHRTAHEDGVGHLGVAELADHPLGAVEVVIGVALDIAVYWMHHGSPLAPSRPRWPVMRPGAPAGPTGARP